MDDELFLEGISITLEQYKLVDGEFVLVTDNLATTTTDEDGNYIFNNLPTFIVEDGNKIPVSYKVKVDALPENYTITKYRVENETISTFVHKLLTISYRNSDLVFDTHYLVAEDEYIILSDVADDISNSYYEFTYKDVTYDIVKNISKDEFDGGLKKYELGSISGTIWEDTNYNGLMDPEELGIADVEITLKQYYLNNGEWIATDMVETQITNADGYYLFDNLSTFVTIDGTNYLVGYTTTVTTMDDNTYAITKYYANNGINDSALVASTKEINKPNEEFDDFIIIAKQYDEVDLNDLHEVYEIFDIVEAIDVTNYDGGLVKVSDEDSMGSISGTIWDDKDKNGLMDEKKPYGIENVTIILEQYKLVDGQFVLVTDKYSTTTTDENGDYIFNNLPTFIVEGENKIPVSYKVKVEEIPNDYNITSYMVNGKESSIRNSDLRKDMYLTDNFIIIAGVSTNSNEFYEFTYEGVVYDILIGIHASNYDGGLYIDRVQTGDTMNLVPYFILLFISFSGMVITFKKRRK